MCTLHVAMPCKCNIKSTSPSLPPLNTWPVVCPWIDLQSAQKCGLSPQLKWPPVQHFHSSRQIILRSDILSMAGTLVPVSAFPGVNGCYGMSWASLRLPLGETAGGCWLRPSFLPPFLRSYWQSPVFPHSLSAEDCWLFW